MNLFQRIASIFTAQRPPGTGSDRYKTIYLYSNRCREALYARVDTMNELSIGEEGEPPWYVRKVVHTSGENRCFSQVEVELWLDGRKQIVRHEVTGGRWLEEAEYDALIDEAIARAEQERLAAEEAEAEEEESSTHSDQSSMGR